MRLLPTCREVARAASSDGLSELPLRRRLFVRWHLLVCRDCLRYVRQLEAIRRIARGLETEPDTECADDEFARLETREARIIDELLYGPDPSDQTRS